MTPATHRFMSTTPAAASSETTRRFTTHAGDLTLSSATEYDAQDRVLREFYPDGTLLEREYTARGLEAPLAGWMSTATWDARGRWTQPLPPFGPQPHPRARHHSGRLHAQQAPPRRRQASSTSPTPTTSPACSPKPATSSAPRRKPRLSDKTSPTTTSTASRTPSGPYGAQSFTYSDDENLLTLAGARPDLRRPPASRRRAKPAANRFTYDAAGQLTRVTGDGPVTPGTWQLRPARPPAILSPPKTAAAPSTSTTTRARKPSATSTTAPASSRTRPSTSPPPPRSATASSSAGFSGPASASPSPPRRSPAATSRSPPRR
jgi:hypothetical protein